MRNGRRTLCLALLCALLALLCGCSTTPRSELLLEHDPSQARDGAEVVLTFCGFKADALNLTAIEKTFDGFMELHPEIYVAYEGIKGTPYWDTLELRNASGSLDDLMMLDHDHILSLREEGKLADLSGLSALENYLPWVREQFTEADGSVYFLPTCVSTYNLYINTDLLERYQLPLPTNRAELAQVCDAFARQGVTPIIANNYASLSTLALGLSLYDVYQAEDTAAWLERFNSGEADLAEQLRPGLELVAEMLARGWLDGEEVRSTAQTSDDLALFSQGERPFMISGGWASPRLKVDFAYGIYPYPILEDGSVLTMQADTCVGVYAGSSRLAQAMELMEYIGQPDAMWNYCDSQSSYSPLKDERIPSDVTIVPSVPYLSNGRSMLRTDARLRLPVEKALRESVDGLLQGMSVEDAVALLASGLYATESAGGSL